MFDSSVTLLGQRPALNVPEVQAPLAGLTTEPEATRLRVNMHGRAGSPTLLVVAGISTAPIVFPGQAFELRLDPATTFATAFGLIDATGVRTLDFPLPPTGVPSGTRLSMQSLELLPSGEVIASNATNVGLW